MASDGVGFRAQHDLAGGEWTRAVALAQLAVAHALVGASRTMLELARVHALERIQFGQPIAAFQAVRHRLADTLVAIEAADAALDSAWRRGIAAGGLRWPRRWPGVAPGRPSATANRSWPASDSPPSTISTTMSAVSWCTTSCSARPGP